MNPNFQVNPNITTQDLTGDITSMQGFSGIYHSSPVVSPYEAPNAAPAGSNLDQFFGKVGSIFKEGAHLLESAPVWAARQLATVAKGTINLPAALAHVPVDIYHTINYSSQSQGLSDRMDQLMKEYKSGMINASEFKSGVDSWTKDSNLLSEKLAGQLTADKSHSNQFLQDIIATTTAITTIATGGLAGLGAAAGESEAASLAGFLTSNAARDFMSPAEITISKLANDAALTKLLPTGVQSGLKGAVTDTFLRAGADMTSKQIARATAINLAIKYPLAFNYLTGTANQVVDELNSGKYWGTVKTIGFNMALLFAGGPIGQALKYGGKGLSAFSGKMLGSTSFIDELSKAAGWDSNAIYMAIKDNPDLIKSFQALEATNVKAESGRVIDAAYRIVNGLKVEAPDIFQGTPESFVKDVHNWAQDQKAVTDWATAKFGAVKARQYVLGRWSAKTANWAFSQLTQPGVKGEEYNSEKVLQQWQQLKHMNPDAAYSNSDNLDKQVTHIIKDSKSFEELHTRGTAIKARLEVDGVPKDLAKRLADNGHLIIAPTHLEAPFVEGKNPLVTKFAGETGAVGKNVGGEQFFQKAVEPVPVLREVGNLLTRLGLSPEKAQQSVSQVFNDRLVENLKGSGIRNLEGVPLDGNFIRSRLADTMNEINSHGYQLNHIPLMDMRQLTTKEIAKSLNITNQQAKEVAGVLADTMREVPASIKGLGNKLTDAIMSVNAGGKVSLGGYLRLQGTGRFAWNPFFKMKASYKYEALAQAAAGGKFPTIQGTNKILGLLFPGRYAEIRATAKDLQDSGLMGSGFAAEAASDTAAGTGITTARLTESHRLTIGSLVMSMADKQGMTAKQFITNFPDEVKNVTEAILHYDPNSRFLNSPLARTLNFVFFPFRFDMKVATAMAKTLGRQDALTQVAVIHGMFQAHQFFTSTEGQIWYQQNADVIGLLEYFTPVAELKVVAALGNIKDESVGSFGELGGLPVGFIPQILAAEGLWNPSTPYVNPKTGLPGAQYIPATDKAKLATAVSSLIGSLFTWPGSTAGLPGKAKNMAAATRALTGSKQADWNVVPETNLTPQQQSYIKAIQAIKSQSSAPSPNTSDQTTIVQPTESGTATPIYTPSQKRSSSKVKKINEPLQLLPGQTQLGQIP